MVFHERQNTHEIDLNTSTLVYFFPLAYKMQTFHAASESIV